MILDIGSLGVLIPILALSIPVLAIAIGGMNKLYKMRLEEARLRSSHADSVELDELRAEVDQLRRELGEVQERVDFTERLLARNAEQSRLPPRPE